MERDWESNAPDEVTSTYRHLRLAMPVLALMLGAAVVLQIFAPSPDCWLGSISAYYYTSARAVFVATLCAIGTCLFVYRGSSTPEDVALNVSGALAFFVALIPTPLAGVVSGPEPVCKRSNVPTPEQLDAALHNNVWAAIAAGAAVGVTYLVLRAAIPPGPGRGRPDLGPTVGTVAAVVASAAVFALWPDQVVAHGHGAAAIALFAGVAAMMAMNAFPQLVGKPPDATPAPFRSLYSATFAMMLAALVFIGVPVLLGQWETGLFWLEASLILLFAAFWVVQTVEHWGSRTSGSPTASDTVEPGRRPVASAADR